MNSVYTYRCDKCGRKAVLIHGDKYPNSLGSWRCPAHGPCKVKRSPNKGTEEAA